MKPRVVLIGGAVVVLSMAACWLAIRREPHVPATHPMSEYRVYTGTEAALRVSFEFPTSWSLREDQGKTEFYRQVRVLGPRNGEDTYSAYLSVRGFPLKAYGGKYDRLEEMVKHYTDHLVPGTKILETGDAGVAGMQATALTVAYTIPPLHHRDLKPKEIPVTTRTLFLEKSPYLYQLVYSSDAREYDQYADSFDHLVSTFRFQ